VKVEEDRIFITDGPVWTSAGMTAGIDLTLAMIEKDLGADVARAVARQLVVYHRRAGDQSQFSALLELEPNPTVFRAHWHICKAHWHICKAQSRYATDGWTARGPASSAVPSAPRPAKAIENLRVEAVRLMMEQSRHSIDVIARQTGFADRDRMRRAFLRAFGQSPQVIRRNARAKVAAHWRPFARSRGR
jgi:transcriptional regulator GlxA family with amidase domain